jgi:SAM-dependent methyltransferase
MGAPPGPLLHATAHRPAALQPTASPKRPAGPHSPRLRQPAPARSNPKQGTMTDWNEGYVTDVTYSKGFYRELSPVWLATAALLLGHRPPDLARPFRWAELGCGHALSAAVFASAHPQAEFWGFDFNPAHIDSARQLATGAGLANLHVEEASFAELAGRPDAALPQFDFIVAHGVYSWIGRDAQLQIIDFLRRRLAPGGLAYLGYNALAGWATIMPLRPIMHLLAEANPGPRDAAVPGILDFLNKLKDGGATFFVNNPIAQARLATLATLDPRYFAHEYLNRNWTPFASSDVAADMAEAKCTWIGSASLLDNMDAASVPPGLLEMMGQLRDPRLREVVRDIACAQPFRRDLFRRGTEPLPPGEHGALLDRLTLVGLGKPATEPLTFATSLGLLTGRLEAFAPLLSLLEAAPLTLQTARSSAGPGMLPTKESVEAFAMLITGGFAHPAVPGTPAIASARGLNMEIARRNGLGHTLPWLAAPAIGSAVPADPIQIAMVADRLAGEVRSPEAMTEHLISVLAPSGRTVQRDGQPVTDPAQVRAILAEQVAVFQRTQHLSRRLGLLVD